MLWGPAHRVETNSPNRLAYAKGGGYMGVFMLLLLGSYGFSGLTRSGSVAGEIVGSILIVVGAWFCLRRAGFTIDRAAGTVTRWSGVLRPMRSETLSLGRFESLRMRCQVLKGDKRNETVYPLILVGSKSRVELDTPDDHQAAREMAAVIAAFLGLKVIDSTEEFVATFDSAVVAQPLRTRINKADVPVDVGPPPVMQSTYSANGNNVVFVMPRNMDKAISAILAILFIVGFSILFSQRKPLPLWACVIPGLMLLVMIDALGSAFRRVIVYAGPEGVRVTRKLFVTRQNELAACDIRDIELVEIRDTHRLIVLSENQSIYFGHGLPEDELRWMRTVLLNAISAE